MPRRSSRRAARISRSPRRRTTQNSPALDPTEGENLELGAKWEFRDGALAVTGAIYDSSNKNEIAQDANDPTVIRGRSASAR